MHFRPLATVLPITFLFGLIFSTETSGKSKQEALEEWRQLTSDVESNSPFTELFPTGRGGMRQAPASPQVFLKNNSARFYFQPEGKLRVFTADWKLDRAPTDKYRVSGARLRSSHWISRIPEDSAWRKARVIKGQETETIVIELQKRLTPGKPGHGFSYEALFADRTLYRDESGKARMAFQKDTPNEVVIDHHFFLAESVETIAKHLDEILAASHPEESLFVLMAPDASRFVQPLLIDRKTHQCVSLCLAALFDSGESGEGFKVTMDGFSALVLESHGLALVKNPISSVTRLADGVVQNSIRLVRLPGVSFKKPTLPVAASGGMDLAEWERYLDRHTGTKLEQGSLRILRDGNEFFGRFRQAVARATNNICANVYIFDRDDVGIELANLLKQRSAELPVKVTCDRLCSVVGAILAKTTPMPDDFVPPAFISSYLRKDSEVEVRPFLNPWISVSHSKLFLVDGNRAWIGGMNVGREYMHEWHDFMIEVEGPVVGSLQTQFDREWAHAGPWGDIAYFAAVSRKPAVTEEVPSTSSRSQVRRLPTSKGLRKPFMAAVLNSLDQARSYIYIENGYLFDHGVVTSLIRARKRGVDVRVVQPRVNNFTAGIRSNLAIAEKLRRNGIRVYLWPGMTHAKVVLVDGWACIGSANLNQWSLRLSEEENMATSDPAFAAELKAKVFEPDFARSYELVEPIRVNFGDHVVDSVLSY